jgi:hypothetical protein
VPDKPSVVEAVTTFHAEVDGEPRIVRSGDRFSSRHPLVKRAPELFRVPADAETGEETRG